MKRTVGACAPWGGNCGSNTREWVVAALYERERERERERGGGGGADRLTQSVAHALVAMIIRPCHRPVAARTITVPAWRHSKDAINALALIGTDGG